MDDRQILMLYKERSEAAIAETDRKYRSLCYRIAYNVLRNAQDAEETVNDAYLRAWDAIPEAQPESLPAYLARITRNLALNRYQYNRAEKRGGGETAIALEELEGILPAQEETDEGLSEVLDRFLRDQSPAARQIFLRRYFYLCSVKEIALALRMGESRVKMSLLRSRERLKKRLQEEGIL